MASHQDLAAGEYAEALRAIARAAGRLPVWQTAPPVRLIGRTVGGSAFFVVTDGILGLRLRESRGALALPGHCRMGDAMR